MKNETALTITSPSNPYIKELTKKKFDSSFFLVEGFHLVEEAYKHGFLDEVIVKTGTPLPLEAKKTIFASEEVIKKLSYSKSPEPVVGVCHYEKPCNPPFNRILVLDRVQDPGNLGAIFRCAIAFGFKDILLLPGTCSPFNPKSIAASQGALFQLALHFLSREDALFELVAKEEVELYATALLDASPFESYPFDKSKRLAFVFGNEGSGVSPRILDHAKAKLFIAMEGIDSLNVAVAAGILLHRVYGL